MKLKILSLCQYIDSITIDNDRSIVMFYLMNLNGEIEIENRFIEYILLL